MRQAQKRGNIELKKEGKRKRQTWKHKFFGLAYVGQTRVPTTEEEKDELFEAGLVEKEILFDELDLPAEEFKKVVLHSFPQLCQAGGYQLCKCIPNSWKLEPLSNRVMTSPLMLRQRCGTSLTYIVPLQKDLDLTPTAPPGYSVSIYLGLCVGGYGLVEMGVPLVTIVKGSFIIGVCIYIQLMESCLICGLKVELS